MAASALVEILDQQLDLAAEDAVLGIDLVEGELRADQFVLAECGVGAGERVVEADLDRLVRERLHHERAGDLHRADRETCLEHASAPHGAAEDVLGHRILP